MYILFVNYLPGLLANVSIHELCLVWLLQISSLNHVKPNLSNLHIHTPNISKNTQTHRTHLHVCMLYLHTLKQGNKVMLAGGCTVVKQESS